MIDKYCHIDSTEQVILGESMNRGCLSTGVNGHLFPEQTKEGASGHGFCIKKPIVFLCQQGDTRKTFYSLL